MVTADPETLRPVRPEAYFEHNLAQIIQLSRIVPASLRSRSRPTKPALFKMQFTIEPEPVIWTGHFGEKCNT
jgi:hypothetical protein